MDELISRQAAIDALNSRKTAEQCEAGKTRNWTVDICADMIKQLPPIQPKTGKWIEYEQEFMLGESLKTVQKTVRECSVCTAKIAGMVGIMNYCPNCGAKMEANNENN